MPGSGSNYDFGPSQCGILPVQNRNIHSPVLPITGKRCRNAQVYNGLSLHEATPRSAKVARKGPKRDGHGSNHTNSRNLSHAKRQLNSSQSQNARIPSHLEPREEAMSCTLTDIQKNFVRQWYDDFALGDSGSSLVAEKVNALATLMEVAPQPVMDYVHRKFVVASTSQVAKMSQKPGFHVNTESHSSSLAEANKTLPATILETVEKYILACHRRRPQSDGRRRVNEGPFRCTYGCGYQTKRPFDWRRHEETHEPQELWLCHLCSQNQDQNPFLVNRRDKFLGHLKSSHKEWEPEAVLKMSKLIFHAKFDPQCPLCPERLSNWDERCKHIQGHYEDGLHSGSRATSGRAKLPKKVESTSDEESSSHEDLSNCPDSSDDGDSEQDIPRSRFDKRDPTGGSGGGSGKTGQGSAYRDGVTGQENGDAHDPSSYNPYSSMGHFGHSHMAFVTQHPNFGKIIRGVSKDVTLPSSLSFGGQMCHTGKTLSVTIGPHSFAFNLPSQFRHLVQDGRDMLGQTCPPSLRRIEELDATDHERVTAESLACCSTSLSSHEENPPETSLYGSMASSGQTPVVIKLEDEAEMEKGGLETTSSMSRTERESSAVPAHVLAWPFNSTIQKKRSYAFFGLNDSFADYKDPNPHMELPHMVTDVYTLQLPPPAYHDSSLCPVDASGTRSMPRCTGPPQAPVHMARMTV
jgi:hypothetical protein